MIASRPTRAGRRGIVLILVLAMLGLMALIGVTFATLSNQARVNARNVARSLIRPHDDELMDFAQLAMPVIPAGPRSGFTAIWPPPEVLDNVQNVIGFTPAQAAAKGTTGVTAENGQVGNLGLTFSQETDLVNFLRILSDGYTAPNPPSSGDGGPIVPQ
jgi:hypothetical protein